MPAVQNHPWFSLFSSHVTTFLLPPSLTSWIFFPFFFEYLSLSVDLHKISLSIFLVLYLIPIPCSSVLLSAVSLKPSPWLVLSSLCYTVCWLARWGFIVLNNLSWIADCYSSTAHSWTKAIWEHFRETYLKIVDKPADDQSCQGNRLCCWNFC